MNRYILLILTVTLTSCASYLPENAFDANERTDLIWPPAPSTPRIKFLHTFKTPEDLNISKGFLRSVLEFFAGSEQNALSRPYAISADEDSLVVADPDSSSVHVYDIRKRTYHKLKHVGEFELESPIGVAHDKNKIFITDSKLNKAFFLDRDYNLLKVVNTFERPTGIALDKVGQRVFITDTLSHKISVFSTDGIFMRKIGERGESDLQFNFPSHLTYANDSLIVNDTMNFRLQATDNNGNLLFSFGKQGDASGYMTQPKGVGVDSDGNIYVADALANRIQIFNKQGQLLLEFGKRGDGLGDFNMPAGVAISDDRIYVADSYNQRIQVFKYLKMGK